MIVNSDTAYGLTKTFPVPQEKLFNAFLDEVILKQIWGVSSISIDARPGGKAAAKLNFGGENRDFVITYKEIINFEKIKWVVRFERFPEKEEVRVELTFKPVSEGTEFTVKMENFQDSAERDDNRNAWGGALNKLEKYLTGKTDN